MQKTSLIWGKILFILTLLIIACKKDPIQLEPLAEEEIMEIIDPFYSVLTEDSI